MSIPTKYGGYDRTRGHERRLGGCTSLRYREALHRQTGNRIAGSIMAWLEMTAYIDLKAGSTEHAAKHIM